MENTGTTVRANDKVVDLMKNMPSDGDQASRKKAMKILEQKGFPAPKEEEYRYTPLTRVLEKFDVTGTTPSTQSDLTLPAVKFDELDAYRIVVINGIPVTGSEQPLCAGLSVKPLSHSLEENFAGAADPEKDSFVAWNMAAWQGGVEIVVQDNTTVDKPVIIHHVSDVRNDSVVTVTRNRIRVGKNSEATVIQKSSASGEHPRFLNILTEAAVDENAGFSLYVLQDEPGEHTQFHHVQIHQKSSSRVSGFTFSFDGSMIRNNLHFLIDGEGCESNMFGLYLLGGKTHVDNHTVADHRKPNSFSNELYKGIIDDKARGVFNGKIFVRPDAQKTNAFQSNRNILMGDQSRVNTKPQLEIWADDVKCSHGCTTGQLDEEALFYLQSRGIEKRAAQAMLLYAFATEVVEAVTIPVIRQYLERAIEHRLQ